MLTASALAKSNVVQSAAVSQVCLDTSLASPVQRVLAVNMLQSGILLCRRQSGMGHLDLVCCPHRNGCTSQQIWLHQVVL